MRWPWSRKPDVISSPGEIVPHISSGAAPLPADLADRAVRALVDLFRHQMDPIDVRALRREIAADPDKWWAGYHFGWGMSVRNYLRQQGGIKDKQLPSGNWDDYYIECIEEALRQS